MATKTYQTVKVEKKTEGVEGVADLRCLRKLGSERRVLGEGTYLRKFRKSDTRPMLQL